MRILNTILVLLIFISCKDLPPYVDDIAFIPPGKANNPEYLVLVNDSPCTDMRGEVGICALKHVESMPVRFKLLPQPYFYKLDFRCGNSDGVHYNISVDILKKQEFLFEISSDILAGKRYLNCIGDIYPSSRESEVSSFFEVRIRIYSKNYMPSSKIYITTYKSISYLILGQNAYFSKIKTKKRWHFLKKQTVFKIPSEIIFAVTETKNMRRSYYGFKKEI